MDSAPVSWEALDTLVIEFAKSENLIEDPSPPSSPCSSPPTPPSPSSSSSYQSRRLIRKIRWFLEAGDIDSAVNLLRRHAPFVLDDLRLLFRLHKQKFIELLRRGTTEDRDSAIDCIRTVLAPCALDAYPEAYEEFKHVLLALVYDKADGKSPVANEWSEMQRFEIAGLVSSILRANLHAHDPVFSMTLRYLICIHKEFCCRQGVSSPISDLTERLLLEEKDPPVTPQETFCEAPPFDEVDIQALAHAVQLTRQGAVDSLKFAKGDLSKAFQNELCRSRLSLSILDELVREYCVYRGIVDPDASLTSGSGLQVIPGRLNPHQQDPGCSSRNCSLEVDCGTSKNSDGESSITNTHVDGPEVSAEISMHDTDADVRYPSEITSSLEDCSTSSYNLSKSSRTPHRSRTYAAEERKRRKRWRGRNDKFGFCLEDHRNKEDHNIINEGCEKSCTSDTMFGIKEDKHDIMLGMKDLTSRGMAAEVVEEVNAMDPEFFAQNPTILFQLKQVEFLKLAGSGDYSNALKVARSSLGPLAVAHPALLKSLKETLLTLLKPTDDATKHEMPLQALASSLQVAIGRRLGLEEPQLMKVMRATLHTHTEWFKLQKCKDRFESLMMIDSLKDAGSPNVLVTILPGSNGDEIKSSQITNTSSTGMAENGSSPQESSPDSCDESAILKVMEFLAVPRADAINMLAHYDGNAETVIQEMFAYQT